LTDLSESQSPTDFSPAVADEWHAPYNPWLIAIVATLATFMEVLDTSIANVALPHIAGNLGASAEDSTWVLTSNTISKSEYEL
jgi:DHA2 family multidrug resistance protein